MSFTARWKSYQHKSIKLPEADDLLEIIIKKFYKQPIYHMVQGQEFKLYLQEEEETSVTFK